MMNSINKASQIKTEIKEETTEWHRDCHFSGMVGEKPESRFIC